MLDVRPALDARGLAIVRAALVQGVAQHAAYESAWRRAGVAEATERLRASERYALSPRRTRGATRA